MLVKIYVATLPWTRSTAGAWSHRSTNVMSVAVSQRHREHRSTIAVASWCKRRVIRSCRGYISATLCTILLRSRYDLATTNALPWRLCYLSIADLGASGTLLLRSCRSAVLHVWFKCFPWCYSFRFWANSVEDLVKHAWFHFHVNDK